MNPVADIWVYLAASPLLWLTLTLAAYIGAFALYEKSGFNPLVNPVAISVFVLVAILLATRTPYATYFEGAPVVHFLLGPATVALAVPLYEQVPKLRRAWFALAVGLLWVTETDYRTYFEGAQFVHFLLGPATVALAVPLYENFKEVRRSALPLTVALVAGSVTAAASAVGIGWALGATRETLLSLAPKSATTPIAMGVAEKIGGLPSLTAVLVILTGILGAVLATWTLNLLRIRDWRTRGFAIGVAAHGIGTARAFQVNEVAGAFASLAMGLNGLATAALLPLLIRLLS